MATTPTPDQLVTQWSGKLRGVAYQVAIDYDDVRQTAWLIAAEMIASGELQLGKWLGAIKTQALIQRDGVNIYPDDDDELGAYIGTGWLLGDSDGLDDPAQAVEAAETVAHRIGGEGGDAETWWKRIRQEIELPRTPAEIAQARGVSERQGRRDAAQIQAARRVQRDLFSVDEILNETEVTE